MTACCGRGRIPTRRRNPRHQHPFHLTAVAWVAPRPSALVIVELREELVPLPDPALPGGQVDGLGQDADGFGCEIPLTPLAEHVGRVEGAGPPAVVDHVTPHLEDPQPADECLVHGPVGQLGQVVDVTPESGPAVPGELLGARLGLGDDRELREGKLVPPVHRKRQERKELGGQDERAPCEFDRCRDVRPAQRRIVDLEVPMAPVPMGCRQREPETRNRGNADGFADAQHHVRVRSHKVEIGGEAPEASETALSKARAALEDQVPSPKCPNSASSPSR